MSQSTLNSVENKLNELLVKKAPFQLPDNVSKWLAEYAWLFALIGCILGVLAFFPLLAVLGLASALSVVAYTGGALLFAWLAFLVLIGQTVVLGVAYPKLKRMEKAGWNLIFYGALFFAVYDVLDWLRYDNLFNIPLLIWNVFWAIVGLYIVFQIRRYFVASPAASKPSATPKSKSAKK